MSIRATLRLFASHPTATLTPLAPRTKLTTTLTGLLIHPSPLPALLTTYADTLHLLSTIPATSVYRQSVESITNERKSIIEKFELKFQGVGGEEAIEAVETEVGMGCVEELLVMAKDELVLVGKMLEWKPFVQFFFWFLMDRAAFN
jgi:NADH dehydrogenase (ubiquinone) 1 alpha subcomplex subunit 5